MPPTLLVMLLRIVFEGLHTPTCEHTEDFAVRTFELLYPNDCYTN